MPTDAHATHPARGATDRGTAVSMVASLAGVACAAGATITSVADLMTRPSCGPNEVRLVDLDPAVPVLCALLLLLGAGVAVLAWRRRGPEWVRAGLAVALLALSAVTFGATVLSLLAHRGGGDGGCWTF